MFVSCRDNKRDELSLLVQKWQGREIVFPNDMIFTKYAKDSIDYEIPQADFKILLYVDSVGCTGCKLKLHRWRKLIDEVDFLTNGNKIPFIFIFQLKDNRELYYLLKKNRIRKPVVIDKNNSFQKKNKLPRELMFNCFLLDRDNKVLCVGNPVYNSKIKDLYFSIMRRSKGSVKISNKKIKE